jgi:hypothetical protein
MLRCVVDGLRVPIDGRWALSDHEWWCVEVKDNSRMDNLKRQLESKILEPLIGPFLYQKKY